MGKPARRESFLTGEPSMNSELKQRMRKIFAEEFVKSGMPASAESIYCEDGEGSLVAEATLRGIDRLISLLEAEPPKGQAEKGKAISRKDRCS